MRSAYAKCTLQDGTVFVLRAGDIIGRSVKAALRLHHEAISEAHAMLSLRGRELVLLRLRGLLRRKGKFHDKIALYPGVDVELAKGISFTVDEVEVPDTALTLQWGELEPVSLEYTNYSLHTQPEPRLEAAVAPDAAAGVWHTEEGWDLLVPGQEAVAIEPGGHWTIAGVELRAAEAPLDGVSPTTRRNLPMEIRVRYETVHLRRPERETVVLSGNPARLVTEVAEFGCPIPWEVLAKELWRDERITYSSSLRQRFDSALVVLRQKLRQADVRDNLVRSSGNGNYELFLERGDTVINEA